MSEASKQWHEDNEHYMNGKQVPIEIKQKISKSHKLLWQDEEHRKKMIEPRIGSSLSEETKRKIGEANKGRIMTLEQRMRMSAAQQQCSIEDWEGFKSFEPYCPEFNFGLKEEIRNRDSRSCSLCGKSEILNGERLSVHHIDGDKMQGCNGKKWRLCALCRSCNMKPDTIEKEFIIISNLYWRIIK